MDDKLRGLYEKFYVERLDGKSGVGKKKHHNCNYFVLDMDHDKHAKAAIEAYVSSLEKCGDYPALAENLRSLYLGERS